MTLRETESGRKILIDLNIRASADDLDDDTPDVAPALRKRLEPDCDGRLYVDALLVSHPDQDHCAGLRKHFHLGPPSEWSSSADKIFIREVWSSPMVFRRASRKHVLCDDAKAFNAEAGKNVTVPFSDSHAVRASANAFQTPLGRVELGCSMRSRATCNRVGVHDSQSASQLGNRAAGQREPAACRDNVFDPGNGLRRGLVRLVTRRLIRPGRGRGPAGHAYARACPTAPLARGSSAYAFDLALAPTVRPRPFHGATGVVK